MESIQNLKKRLKSVANINKITKAMEMVAATKMRKSQEIALASRPYAFVALDMLTSLTMLETTKELQLPEILQERNVKKTMFVLVASDKGLAGAFNSALFRKFEKYVKEHDAKYQEEKVFLAVGEKSFQYLNKKGVKSEIKNIKLADLTLSVLGRLVTFRLSYKTLGGPIRIAQASAMAAKTGFSEFLYFLAFLSLQLGLLNLLPFPVLDGGHLLFFGIEGIRRRPVSARVRGIAEQTGFVLLVTLMLLVTLNDVESVWGFRQIFETVKGWF